MSLWLRSERAMGLPGVARNLLPDAAGNAGSEPAEPSAPVAAPTPVRARPATTAATPPSPTSRGASSGPAGETTLLVPLPVAPVIEGPELSRDQKAKLLGELDEKSVSGCTKCGLSRTRTRTVFGEGDPGAQLVFVGEGPGKDEDASGRPFVGRAGQKLDDMIRAMGLQRNQVFICNIVKCRAFLPGPPPKDRPPSDEETAACSPYLVRQLEILRPKVIVTLGLPATRYLLSSKESMSRMRGRWHAWRGIKVMPTWHPAYVLRNYTPETRAQVWDDLQKVMLELGIPLPKGSGKQT